MLARAGISTAALTQSTVKSLLAGSIATEAFSITVKWTDEVLEGGAKATLVTSCPTAIVATEKEIENAHCDKSPLLFVMSYFGYLATSDRSPPRQRIPRMSPNATTMSLTSATIAPRMVKMRNTDIKAFISDLRGGLLLDDILLGDEWG